MSEPYNAERSLADWHYNRGLRRALARLQKCYGVGDRRGVAEKAHDYAVVICCKAIEAELGDHFADISKKVEEPVPHAELAVYLHEKYCTCNHTDGCFWSYENDCEDSWGGYAHQRWLKEAQELLGWLKEAGDE